MIIEVDHPKFSAVELRGGALMVHCMQGEPRVLRENVQDVAVTVQGSLLRIAAFMNQDYAWFLSGEEELSSERVELGEPYGGGGRLINDGLGNSHLFYFVRQSPGSSSLLRHQRFTEQWSKAQTVSANVFGEPWGFSVTWHTDQYLHLAYLAHKDQRLLYRVYDLEHGLWSGAVAFSGECCSYPQFISAGELYLFWLEELEKTTLKVKQKAEHWSESITLSSGEQHAAVVGYDCADKEWSVLWGEGSHFYQASFGQWKQPQQVERGDFEYVWRVQGGLTIPTYKGKKEVQVEAVREEVSAEKPPEPEEQVQHTEPDPELERVRRRREAEQAQAQAAFMEQAFRTLKEWESLKEEVRRWQQELKPQPPLDLTPLTSRLERLERRFLSWQRAQEEEKRQGAASVAQLERELFRLRARLEELEQQNTKPRGFWQRFLSRV
ncbi:hypothetical protein [Candidatus Darwinibacter acetoxidans]